MHQAGRHIPTTAQAEPILKRLTELTAATIRVRKDKPPELDHGDCGYIRVRIAHHLDIARAHPSQPDGYPTRTPGADMTTAPRNNDDDEEGSVNLTSVEAAVEARTRHRDQYDQWTALAYQHTQIAVSALAAAKQLLEKLDQLSAGSDTPGAEDDRWCDNHMRHGYPHEPRASNGGRHCRWCADFQRANGEYPNAELIDYRHRHGKLTDAIVRRLQPSALKEPA